VEERVLQRASETFPSGLALGAIHLLIGVFVRGSFGLDMLLTYGSQLATAAQSLGIGVIHKLLSRATLLPLPR
jgi:hypothetical protein